MKYEQEKDDIGLRFFTRLNLKQQKTARELLQILFTHGLEVSPEMFEDSKGWSMIHRDNIEEFVEKWSGNTNILMRRNLQYQSKLAVQMGYGASGGYNTVHIWVEEDYFTLQSQVENFLKLSIKIYSLLSPEYGSIHQTSDKIELSTIQDPVYGKTVLPTDLRKGLPGIYWANYFGPQLVERIGKKKLLSIPVESVMELVDGGVLIITSPSPLEPSSEANRARQMAAREYIGEELFYPRYS